MEQRWRTLMGDCPRYDIRVAGPLSDELTAMLGALVLEEPAHTILFACETDQGQLLGLINRLSAFGLELVGVRRVACRDRHSATQEQLPGGDRAAMPCYEVSVRGLLGPVLLAALGDFANSSVQRSRMWTVRCTAPDGPTDLMARLAAQRALIVGVHRVEHTARDADPPDAAVAG